MIYIYSQLSFHQQYIAWDARQRRQHRFGLVYFHIYENKIIKTQLRVVSFTKIFIVAYTERRVSFWHFLHWLQHKLSKWQQPLHLFFIWLKVVQFHHYHITSHHITLHPRSDQIGSDQIRSRSDQIRSEARIREIKKMCHFSDINPRYFEKG